MIPAPSLHRMLCAGICCLWLTGCAGFGKRPVAPPPEEAPARKVGTVVLVNAERGFLLAEVFPGFDPRAGTELRVVGPQGDTVFARVSPERRRPFLVADFTEGIPVSGAEVFR